ncbi:hypothetical protein PV433_11345 [Paenibacillus sp. GYB004]|uniref:WD40/YVTN/BNR-like repeat-containing protein n=1 Tax=Paenibacillus sp. GYB004 TaxID=2994393 RepID=UPI002F969F7D
MAQKQKSSIKLEWIFLAVLIVLLILVVVSLMTKSNSANELKPGSAIHPHTFSYAPDGETLWIGTHQGIYELTDGKWLQTVPALSSSDVMGLEIDPSNSDNIIVSGHGFIKRSQDRGGNWNPIEAGMPNQPKPDVPDAHQLTMDSKNGSHLYTVLAGPGDNVYETNDGGNTWGKVGKIPTALYSIAVAPDNENSLLAGSELGLVRYDFINEDMKETKISNEPAYQILMLSSGEIIVMNEGGFSRSKDMKTWTPMNINLNGEIPLGIKASKKDPAKLAIVTQNYSVYESKNSGQSWTQTK